MWGLRADQEVKKDPSTINATVGVAQDDDGTISHLKFAESFAGEALTRVPKAKVFGYAPIPGTPGLRQKWKAEITKIHPELANYICDPVVTNGITHALYSAGQLVLNPGDTIIFPEKSWENYHLTFGTLLNAKIKNFRLFSEEKLDIQSIIQACEESAAAQKKIILLLNFPHNQTGYMPSPSELRDLGAALQNLCLKYPDIPVVVLIDDAYEGYIYDDKGQTHSPYGEIFALAQNLTVFKLDGASKKFLMYGSRIGFITPIINKSDGSVIAQEENAAVSKEFTSKLGALVRGAISQVNHHGQILAEAALDNYAQTSSEREKIISVLKKRWEALMRAVSENEREYGSSRLKMDPCNSGFFAFFNLKKEISPTAFVEKLIADERAVVFPAESDFGLRVAFCSVAESKIPALVNKIYSVAGKIDF